MKVLSRDFYKKNPEIVAKELLGKALVRKLNGETLSGMIVETEAYLAADDYAAHAAKRKTAKTKSLYLDGGHAYVHNIHAYSCLDAVCQDPDLGGSVLIRALMPLDGIETMKELRGNSDINNLTSGPGKLCRSMAIDKKFDGIDLTNESSELVICELTQLTRHEIFAGPRIGISRSKDFQLRFYIKGNKFVSR